MALRTVHEWGLRRPRVAPTGRGLPLGPSEEAWEVTSRIDPTDPRIDVSAKFALQRLLRGPKAPDAAGMISAIQDKSLAGIFGDDLVAAVKVAQRHGTYRWLLVPKGEDAALVLDPDDPASVPPTIIFRDAVRGNPARMDPALVRAWQSFKLWHGGRLACRRSALDQTEILGLGPLLTNVVPVCGVTTANCHAGATRDGIEFSACQPALVPASPPGQQVRRPAAASSDTWLLFETRGTRSVVNPRTGRVGPAPLPTFTFTAKVAFDSLNAPALSRWEVGWIQNVRPSRWIATYADGTRRCRVIRASCLDMTTSALGFRPPWQTARAGPMGPQPLVPTPGGNGLTGVVDSVLMDLPSQPWPLFLDGRELRTLHAGSILMSWLVALRGFAPLDRPLQPAVDIVFLWSCRVTLDITWTLSRTQGANPAVQDAVFAPLGTVNVEDGPGFDPRFRPLVLCRRFGTQVRCDACNAAGQGIESC